MTSIVCLSQQEGAKIPQARDWTSPLPAAITSPLSLPLHPSNDKFPSLWSTAVGVLMLSAAQLAGPGLRPFALLLVFHLLARERVGFGAAWCRARCR
ncbi:hypothetical protein CALVIDRAFT_287657 [Calocera viscosa TUFC12733]|uniref:Uncharacterized protein n=1 Tax=Calocera viscosa (strain TUFC12733) TaxID=1330018 RepID=A0A167IWD0_CALVF|nr:hypothetical protein CALVIDRAFT_287657 [Calocera viscosa TUFC12733]